MLLSFGSGFKVYLPFTVTSRLALLRSLFRFHISNSDKMWLFKPRSLLTDRRLIQLYSSLNNKISIYNSSSHRLVGFINFICVRTNVFLQFCCSGNVVFQLSVGLLKFKKKQRRLSPYIKMMIDRFNKKIFYYFNKYKVGHFKFVLYRAKRNLFKYFFKQFLRHFSRSLISRIKKNFKKSRRFVGDHARSVHSKGYKFLNLSYFPLLPLKRIFRGYSTKAFNNLIPFKYSVPTVDALSVHITPKEGFSPSKFSYSLSRDYFSELQLNQCTFFAPKKSTHFLNRECHFFLYKKFIYNYICYQKSRFVVKQIASRYQGFRGGYSNFFKFNWIFNLSQIQDVHVARIGINFILLHRFSILKWSSFPLMVKRSKLYNYYLDLVINSKNLTSETLSFNENKEVFLINNIIKNKYLFKCVGPVLKIKFKKGMRHKKLRKQHFKFYLNKKFGNKGAGREFFFSTFYKEPRFRLFKNLVSRSKFFRYLSLRRRKIPNFLIGKNKYLNFGFLSFYKKKKRVHRKPLKSVGIGDTRYSKYKKYKKQKRFRKRKRLLYPLVSHTKYLNIIKYRIKLRRELKFNTINQRLHGKRFKKKKVKTVKNVKKSHNKSNSKHTKTFKTRRRVQNANIKLFRRRKHAMLSRKGKVLRKNVKKKILVKLAVYIKKKFNKYLLRLRVRRFLRRLFFVIHFNNYLRGVSLRKYGIKKKKFSFKKNRIFKKKKFFSFQGKKTLVSKWPVSQSRQTAKNFKLVKYK